LKLLVKEVETMWDSLRRLLGKAASLSGREGEGQRKAIEPCTEIERPSGTKGYLAATMESADDVRAELAKWSGSLATVLSYAFSHSVLTIRLVREGVKGNLHLDCLSVVRFCGPVSCKVERLVVEETTLRRGLPGFRIKDGNEKGLSVLCGDLILTRDVDPVYSKR
jgi:hypothetical protein